MDFTGVRESKEDAILVGAVPGIGLRSPLPDSDNSYYVADDENAVNEFFVSGMHFSPNPNYVAKRR